MIILASDQSITSYGYSIIELSSNKYNVLQYGVIKLDTDIDYFQRILTLQPILDNIIKEFRVNEFVLEDIQMQKKAVTVYRKLCFLLCYIQLYCHDRDIPFEVVQVNQWRKKVVKNQLGLENGSKNELYQYIKSIISKNSQEISQDHTDAIGLGLYSAYRRDIFNGRFNLAKKKDFKMK